MARQDQDKTSKWIIKHHGNSLLFLGGAGPIRRWKATQPEVVQPRKLPDGLLEVHFLGKSQPTNVLVEIGTYPEPRLLKQAWDDLLLVCLDQGTPPDLLVLILRPKGRIPVPDHRELEGELGWSKMAASWKVVRLWEVPAEQLLATNDVGLVPWLPLTKFEGSPEPLIRECRERIDRQAAPNEHANLLAVTQVLTKLRFPQPDMLRLLGGSNPVIESPLLDELRKETEQAVRVNTVLEALSTKFRSVPEALAREIRAVDRVALLKDLHREAIKSKNLADFQKRMKGLQGRRE